jgi:norsolorinic acid ketoreductase
LLKEGVRSIDILIASAGLGTAFHPIQNTTLSSVTEHFFINTLGPLSLFQSLRPLLLPDTLPEGEGEQGYKRKEKKFTVISSSLGSIGDMEKDTRSLAYGISKAGVNYLVRKCHFEEEGVVSGAVHPGYVRYSPSFLSLPSLLFPFAIFVPSLHFFGPRRWRLQRI